MLFIFLRGLRLSKFDLFIRCFQEMLLWSAASDNSYYLRWGLIFPNDMKIVPDSIKELFNQGNFVVKKTGRAFSAMGIDQALEKNNRAVKVDNWAIGIMDNESGLLKWALSGSYVAEMICESTNTCPSNHHEDAKSLKKEFGSRRIKLIEAFKHIENPYSHNPPEKLMNIVSKEIMSAKASSSVRSPLKIRQS